MPVKQENRFKNIKLPKHLPMLVMSSTTKCGKQNKNKQDNKENYES